MRPGPGRAALCALVGVWILQTVTASSQAARALDVARARTVRHLDELLTRHGVPGEIDHRELRLQIDERGKTHRAVQEMYRGVPVFGGEAIVHVDADGSLASVTDNYVSSIGPLDTRPILTARDAIDRALEAYGVDESVLTAPPLADLWILRRQGQDRLAYRVQLRREDQSSQTAMPVYFIDAGDGSMAWAYDNLQTAGTGVTLYSATVPIETFQSGPTFYLEDLTRRLGIFDFRNGTTSVFRVTDSDNIWDGASQRAAVDAHYAAQQFYDYFLNVHGRKGIDGNGGPGFYPSADGTVNLVSGRVHYSSRYNNAFWDGQVMTYGDGDGTLYGPLVTLDIGGHEMMHGVTQYTANLTYANESGALNESLSDIFGAMVERFAHGGAVTADTWKIGEQAYTPGIAGDALRYLDNPHAGADNGFTPDDDPDHYEERYTGTADNGGVHVNSGISNKAFYLLAAGGTHHRSGVSVKGIGADAAEKIFYRALTTYMTSSTDFAGARVATANAASDLFGPGSAEKAATELAWCAVGVGGCQSAPPKPGDNGAELIVNGGFESSPSPWVGAGNGIFYTNSPGQFPHAGSGYVFLGNSNSTASTIYQQISIPAKAAAPTLTFWLNVTTAETTTTSQFDKLFVEVRDPAGILLSTLATFSNLNKGTLGAYAAEGTFRLADFRGQTVRIQFRATTDAVFPTTFRIDDVSVQTGKAPPEPTVTVLTVSPASPTAGNSVTLTATVKSAACDVQGVVTFADGQTTLAEAVPLDSTQQAETTVRSFSAGSHAISASFTPSSSACAASSDTATITVARSEQTIAFASIGDRRFGDPPITLAATSSSGLPVLFTLLSGPAQLENNLLTMLGAGTVVIRASQNGDSDYNAAPDIIRSFEVSRAEQSIVLGPLANKQYGDAPVLLNATASSGEPVAFQVLSGPASVSGNVLTILGAGDVVVRASAAGNTNYEPAPVVDRSFTISTAPLVVSANNAARAYCAPDPLFTGTISGLVAGDVISASFATATTESSPAGTYPIGISLLDPTGRLVNYNVAIMPGTFTITNPVPAILGVNRNTAAAGSTAVAIEISGQNFVPDASVRWNGTPIQTTFSSCSLLQADIPATDFAAVGVGYLTVSQPTPGGGTSNFATFFVTTTGAHVTASDSATSAGTATTTIGDQGETLTVTAEGDGTVTIAQFTDNPGPRPIFRDTGSFFDVFVAPGSTLTAITIVNCDMSGGNLIEWSNGGNWTPVSNQRIDPATGCVTIRVGSSTSPSLSDLTGTFFGTATDRRAPRTNASASEEDGSRYEFGEWTNQPVTVTLVAKDETGGSATITYTASGATSIPATTASGRTTFTITADATTTITYYATDVSGNAALPKSRRVRIDRTAPDVTVQAAPAILRPENGKLDDIRISGRIADALSGIATARYTIRDQDGDLRQHGHVEIGHDGRYHVDVRVPASRHGHDADDRLFTILIEASDCAGNQAVATTTVTVAKSRR